jgi:uncharacterized membrane protein required for colicin V production
MNEFDLLLIVFILVGVLIGAVRGAVRQLIGLFSAWLGLIICLWLYRPFSRQILMGMFRNTPREQLNPAVFDTFAFVMLLIVFAVIVQLIFLFTSRSPEEKRQTQKVHWLIKANEKNTVSLLNILGGLVTGLITTVVWISIVLAPFQWVLYSLETPGNFQQSLLIAINNSGLLPYFYQVLYWIYLSIRFFIPPTGLPAIFGNALNSFIG